MNKSIVLLITLLCIAVVGNAQGTMVQPDTVFMTVSEAETRLVAENLTLLAAHYDIDLAKTKVLDAKLWNNPNINYAQGLYTPTTGKYLDNTKTGTYSIQIQQLFSIAGKHTNTVKLSRINEKMTEMQFNDMVRSLKYQLYTDMNTLNTDQMMAKVFDYQMEKLAVLLTSMNQEKTLGVIAGNEVLRVRAELEELKNTAAMNFSEMMTTEKDLKILLNLPFHSYIIVKELPIPTKIIPSLPELIAVAATNRADLMLTKATVEYQMQNIKLQKSLAVPDLTLGVSRDESGSFAPNIEEISIGFDVPLFNRNQHQIKMAKHSMAQAIIKDSLQRNTLENEVADAVIHYQNMQKQFNTMDSDFDTMLEEMNTSALANYSKHFISLVDFLDQIRTFSASKTSFLQLKKQKIDAINYLNFVVGIPIIK